MDINLIIRQVALFFIPFLLSLSIHEAAHAFVANKLGDSTAKHLGRVTLNPLPHMDLFGTVIFPLISIIYPQAGIFFGWGKPVPVNHLNLKNPKRDFFWISLAGPLSNLILAIISAVIFHVLLRFFTPELMNQNTNVKIIQPIFVIINTLINLNIALFVFNLIPIPPLDGSSVLAGLLPDKYAQKIYNLEQVGFFIFLLFIISGIYKIIAIPIIFITNLLKFIV